MQASVSGVKLYLGSRGSISYTGEGPSSVVEVTGSSEEWRSLIPSLLGPFHVIDERRVSSYYSEGIQPGFQVTGSGQMALCRSVSNCFHYSLIYESDVSNGLVTRDFFERRSRGFSSLVERSSSLAKRGPPVALYFDGRIHDLAMLNYYFCHYYSHVVRYQPAFEQLRELASSTPLTIVVDDVEECDCGFELSGDYLRGRYERGAMGPKSYGLVLASLLMGVEPWITPN